MQPETEPTEPKRMAYEISVRHFDLDNNGVSGWSTQLLRVVRVSDPCSAIIGALAEEDCTSTMERCCKPPDLTAGAVESILAKMLEQREAVRDHSQGQAEPSCSAVPPGSQIP